MQTTVGPCSRNSPFTGLTGAPPFSPLLPGCAFSPLACEFGYQLNVTTEGGASLPPLYFAASGSAVFTLNGLTFYEYSSLDALLSLFSILGDHAAPLA